MVELSKYLKLFLFIWLSQVLPLFLSYLGLLDLLLKTSTHYFCKLNEFEPPENVFWTKGLIFFWIASTIARDFVGKWSSRKKASTKPWAGDLTSQCLEAQQIQPAFTLSLASSRSCTERPSVGGHSRLVQEKVSSSSKRWVGGWMMTDLHKSTKQNGKRLKLFPNFKPLLDFNSLLYWFSAHKLKLLNQWFSTFLVL